MYNKQLRKKITVFLLLLPLSTLPSNALFDVLDQYERPFTLLEVGAQDTALSFEIAQKYNCLCVVFGSESLHQQCLAKKPNNIILLGAPPTQPVLDRFNECEYMDIILTHNEKTITFCTYSGTRYLKRKLWFEPSPNNKHYRIESSFEKSELTKHIKTNVHPFSTTEWLAGINVVTFKMCWSLYPTNTMLKELVANLKNAAHNDWSIKNMVLQGSSITLIDNQDPLLKKPVYCSAAKLHHTLDAIGIDEPEQFQLYYQMILDQVPNMEHIGIINRELAHSALQTPCANDQAFLGDALDQQHEFFSS